MVHLVEIVEMYGNYLIDDRDLTRIPDLSLVSYDFQDSQLRISFFLKAKSCLFIGFCKFPND